MLEAYRRIMRSMVDHVYVAETPVNAVTTIVENSVRLVLLDLRIPGYDALETIEKIKSAVPAVGIIVITGHGTVSDAVAALKAGASDFLEKPVERFQLQARIEPLKKIYELECETDSLRRRIDSTFRFPSFVGSSPAIAQIKSTIVQVAKTDVTVMIAGETGTGKEVTAQSIHAHSDRADGPFVVVDCGSIRESMIESELFGHKKGAFTGALDANQGLIRAADGGTLFLDEIGELPLDMQVKFLRVLQQREVRAIGTTRAVPVDIRVISATNKDIKQAIAAGTFRADLYFRLNTVVLNMPPLRDHPEDITELAHYFLSKHQPSGGPPMTLTPDAVSLLMEHSWPGNARELENVIMRSIAFSTNGVVDASTIAFDQDSFSTTSGPEDNAPYPVGHPGGIPGNPYPGAGYPGNGYHAAGYQGNGYHGAGYHGNGYHGTAGPGGAPAGNPGVPPAAGNGWGPAPGSGHPVPAAANGESLDDHERRIIYQAIADNGGNKKAAAQQLGIAESTLHRKLKRMNGGH